MIVKPYNVYICGRSEAIECVYVCINKKKILDGILNRIFITVFIINFFSFSFNFFFFLKSPYFNDNRHIIHTIHSSSNDFLIDNFYTDHKCFFFQVNCRSIIQYFDIKINDINRLSSYQLFFLTLKIKFLMMMKIKIKITKHTLF